MEILDAPQTETIDPNTVIYGGFWVRFGAMFIDGLVLAPVSVGVTYYNATSAKSPLLHCCRLPINLLWSIYMVLHLVKWH
jgi:hypothetical protein